MAINTELLEQQLAQAGAKKKPAPVKVPARVGIDYNTELKRLARQVRADIISRLVPVLKQTESQYRQTTDAAPRVTRDSWVDDITRVLSWLRDKYSSPEFRALADRAATLFVQTADTVNRRKFGESMRSVGVNVWGDSPELADFIKSATWDNAQLIRSIPDQYLSQVQNIVMTNVRAGVRSSAIVQQLAKQYGVTERRARMIARDQTSKVNGQLVKLRQTSAGFPYFQWLDSDDERVRDRHAYLAEHVTEYGPGVYRWDNPPLSDDGQPIIPGQDYQCRCNARPVSQAEVDANKKAGKTRPGVKH